jgi:hypothetical protein
MLQKFRPQDAFVEVSVLTFDPAKACPGSSLVSYITAYRRFS